MLARIRVHLANARFEQSARAALRCFRVGFLLAVNRQGKVCGRRRRRRTAVDSLGSGSGDEMVLPSSLQQWLEAGAAAKAGQRRPPGSLPIIRNCGCITWATRLERVSAAAGQGRGPHLPADFPANSAHHREGEVLAWLSKGKTNRDIAADPGG